MEDWVRYHGINSHNIEEFAQMLISAQNTDCFSNLVILYFLQSKQGLAHIKYKLNELLPISSLISQINQSPQFIKNQMITLVRYLATCRDYSNFEYIEMKCFINSTTELLERLNLINNYNLYSKMNLVIQIMEGNNFFSAGNTANHPLQNYMIDVQDCTETTLVFQKLVHAELRDDQPEYYNGIKNEFKKGNARNPFVRELMKYKILDLFEESNPCLIHRIIGTLKKKIERINNPTSSVPHHIFQTRVCAVGVLFVRALECLAYESSDVDSKIELLMSMMNSLDSVKLMCYRLHTIHVDLISRARELLRNMQTNISQNYLHSLTNIQKIHQLLSESGSGFSIQDTVVLTVPEGLKPDNIVEESHPLWVEKFKKFPSLESAINHFGEKCSICLDHFTTSSSIAVLSSCDHLYHSSCIQNWFEQSNVDEEGRTIFTRSCPYCRRDVLDFITGSNYEKTKINTAVYRLFPFK